MTASAAFTLGKFKRQHRGNGTGVLTTQTCSEVQMDKRKLPKAELLRKLLSYDPETGTFVWKPRSVDMFDNPQTAARWNSKFAGKQTCTTVKSDGYVQGCIQDVRYQAHRIAWCIAYGEDPDCEIDHINGDRSDNRLDNLRKVSRAQNARNQKRNSRNTSGVVGVRWLRKERRWQAEITKDRKVYHLGRFTDFTDAVSARVAAEKRLGFHPNHGRSS